METEEIKIEKNIPIPIYNHRKYPIGEMEIGDSFFIKTETIEKARRKQSILGGCVRNQRIKDRKFRTRISKDPYGVRMWRVK